MTNIYRMFNGCSSLKEISNFNSNKVIDMDVIFPGCPEKLKKKIMSHCKIIKSKIFY